MLAGRAGRLLMTGKSVSKVENRRRSWRLGRRAPRDRTVWSSAVQRRELRRQLRILLAEVGFEPMMGNLSCLPPTSRTNDSGPLLITFVRLVLRSYMTFSLDKDVGGGLGGCRLVASMCGRVRIYITLPGALQSVVELCTSDFLHIPRYKVGLCAENHLMRTETTITAGPGPQA